MTSDLSLTNISWPLDKEQGCYATKPHISTYFLVCRGVATGGGHRISGGDTAGSWFSKAVDFITEKVGGGLTVERHPDGFRSAGAYRRTTPRWVSFSGLTFQFTHKITFGLGASEGKKNNRPFHGGVDHFSRGSGRVRQGDPARPRDNI